MNDLEHERLEAQLKRLMPARPPANFMARLVAAEPSAQVRPTPPQRTVFGIEIWLRMLRWLAPATAVAVAAVIVWRVGLAPEDSPRQLKSIAAVPASNGDDVKIDHELVSSFDAVGRLPDGEPVRFRCQNWMDQVVLNDERSGMMVQQRTPRMEVVPVRFETY